MLLPPIKLYGSGGRGDRGRRRCGLIDDVHMDVRLGCRRSGHRGRAHDVNVDVERFGSLYYRSYGRWRDEVHMDVELLLHE